MRVRCPTCQNECDFDESNRWRPFCSKRCWLIDLGAWADESHRIPGEPAVPPDGDELPGEEPPTRH